MCRLCPVPEWGEPIKVAVADLPAFFAKQISWNFERLNFGNGAVIDTASGRAERPTITGKVGCKLKDGMKQLTSRSHMDRYLLVSECLFCPGRRYGCTPRANCTGKRRHCYALCKVSVYADECHMSEIYFSGNHGDGDVTDVNKHRVSTAIKNELKRRRLDGASTDEALMWFKKFVEDQGLNSSDPRLVPNDSQIKQMLKRLTPTRPTMAQPEGTETVRVITTTENTSMQTDTEDSSEANNEPSASEVSWSAVSMGEATEHTTSDDNEENTSTCEPAHPSPSTVHVTFTPLSSPLNTPYSMPSGGGLGQQVQTLYLAQNPARSLGPSYTSLRLGGAPGGGLKSSPNLSKREANIQLEGKEKEMSILRHHIRILEQENLGKISRIAELEMQLHSLKENDLLRLGSKVRRLEAESLRKDVRILQLERQLHLQITQTSTPLNNPESTACSGESQTIVSLEDVEVEHVTNHVDIDNT